MDWPLCKLESFEFVLSGGSQVAWRRSAVEGVRAPAVRVFVSRSSLGTMRKVYSGLGGAVEVQPLRFAEHELDAEAVLSMMAVEDSESAPLYMHRVLVRPTILWPCSSRLNVASHTEYYA